jgi:hypothetical protein
LPPDFQTPLQQARTAPFHTREILAVLVNRHRVPRHGSEVRLTTILS